MVNYINLFMQLFVGKYLGLALPTPCSSPQSKHWLSIQRWMRIKNLCVLCQLQQWVKLLPAKLGRVTSLNQGSGLWYMQLMNGSGQLFGQQYL